MSETTVRQAKLAAIDAMAAVWLPTIPAGDRELFAELVDGVKAKSWASPINFVDWLGEQGTYAPDRLTLEAVGAVYDAFYRGEFGPTYYAVDGE